jgi:hypothetical protein
MLQYNLYKGVAAKQGNSKNFGACQFSFKSANLEAMEPGVIFVNACSAVGPNKYDWDNKFIFALSTTDVSKILHFFVSAGPGESLSLVHDPNKGREGEGSVIKQMSWYTKNGCLSGAMITCSTKQNKENTSHRIPVSGDEIIALKCLFEAAIPAMMAWR